MSLPLRLRLLPPAAALLVSLTSPACPASAADTQELVTWLIKNDADLRGLPLGEVVEAATGKKILPVDPAADRVWLDPLSRALDRTLAALNTPTDPIHSAARINEASRFIEDRLREELNREPGWECSVPRTADGHEQRSGYPDLRLRLADGSVVYLDPKLFDTDARDSTLRTFYYEPRTLTGKIHDDARHLLVGIHHNGKPGPDLQLLGWELVDASRIRVQLKAEFQTSNKELYREGNVIGRSAPE